MTPEVFPYLDAGQYKRTDEQGRFWQGSNATAGADEKIREKKKKV